MHSLHPHSFSILHLTLASSLFFSLADVPSACLSVCVCVTVSLRVLLKSPSREGKKYSSTGLKFASFAFFSSYYVASSAPCDCMIGLMGDAGHIALLNKIVTPFNNTLIHSLSLSLSFARSPRTMHISLLIFCVSLSNVHRIGRSSPLVVYFIIRTHLPASLCTISICCCCCCYCCLSSFSSDCMVYSDDERSHVCLFTFLLDRQ